MQLKNQIAIVCAIYALAGKYTNLVVNGICENTNVPDPVPVQVDVNRVNDGVSSISPFSATSPSFQVYNGPHSNGYDTRQLRVLQEVDTTFTVHANVPWNPSGVNVTIGSYYTIAADTEQLWHEGDIGTNAGTVLVYCHGLIFFYL